MPPLSWSWVIYPLLATAAYANAGEVKVNWQDGWREDIKSCMRTKADLFMQKGKPITRKLEELPPLLADKLLGGKAKKGSAKSKKERKADAKKANKKLTRKERMKQELLGSLANSFDAVTNQLPQEDRERKMYEQQALQFLSQAANRAHLKPEDKVTLQEFCDVVWRAGNPSPLDEDDPPPKEARGEDEVEL